MYERRQVDRQRQVAYLDGRLSLPQAATIELYDEATNSHGTASVVGVRLLNGTAEVPSQLCPRKKTVTRALHRLGPFAIASWSPDGPLFNLIDTDRLRSFGSQLSNRLSAMLDELAEDCAVQEALDRVRGE